MSMGVPNPEPDPLQISNRVGIQNVTVQSGFNDSASVLSKDTRTPASKSTHGLGANHVSALGGKANPKGRRQGTLLWLNWSIRTRHTPYKYWGLWTLQNVTRLVVNLSSTQTMLGVSVSKHQDNETVDTGTPTTRRVGVTVVFRMGTLKSKLSELSGPSRITKPKQMKRSLRHGHSIATVNTAITRRNKHMSRNNPPNSSFVTNTEEEQNYGLLPRVTTVFPPSHRLWIPCHWDFQKGLKLTTTKSESCVRSTRKQVALHGKDSRCREDREHQGGEAASHMSALMTTETRPPYGNTRGPLNMFQIPERSKLPELPITDAILLLQAVFDSAEAMKGAAQVPE
ncbi:hypothetical protein BS47DRAFT_1396422 [Hydnum rufescens UP504]|uniref:Uncharacterized protein n=1 Tax=Hydnum rufescens UP504 TaxID=1448309 RepID=A0A9P6AQ49_9AGAM|nr:hypothetical protein BS47DRAFT_1396422 [Hydnum rufescens UP504]